MAYGLLNAGQSTKKQAMAGLRQSAREENDRKIANERLEMAEKQADNSLMATGASIGAMHGINTVGTAGTLANGVASSVAGTAGTAGASAVASAGTGAVAGGSASAITGAGALAGGLATMGIGLIGAWALAELF